MYYTLIDTHHPIIQILYCREGRNRERTFTATAMSGLGEYTYICTSPGYSNTARVCRRRAQWGTTDSPPLPSQTITCNRKWHGPFTLSLVVVYTRSRRRVGGKKTKQRKKKKGGGQTFSPIPKPCSRGGSRSRSRLLLGGMVGWMESGLWTTQSPTVAPLLTFRGGKEGRHYIYTYVNTHNIYMYVYVYKCTAGHVCMHIYIHIHPSCAYKWWFGDNFSQLVQISCFKGR